MRRRPLPFRPWGGPAEGAPAGCRPACRWSAQVLMSWGAVAWKDTQVPVQQHPGGHPAVLVRVRVRLQGGSAWRERSNACMGTCKAAKGQGSPMPGSSADSACRSASLLPPWAASWSAAGPASCRVKLAAPCTERPHHSSYQTADGRSLQR